MDEQVWPQCHWAGSASAAALQVEAGNLAPWPAAWTEERTKAYPRHARTALPTAAPEDFGLALLDVLRARTSSRSADNLSVPVDLKQVGKLLDACYRPNRTTAQGQNRRPYPSAGARFPVELYVLNRVCEGLEPGLAYHYDPITHALEHLDGGPPPARWATLFGFDWIAEASMILVFTAVMSRTTVKYGDRGYRYALIEAGHAAQNLLLGLSALGLSACPVGGFADMSLLRDLDLEHQDEIPIYSLVVN